MNKLGYHTQRFLFIVSTRWNWKSAEWRGDRWWTHGAVTSQISGCEKSARYMTYTSQLQLAKALLMISASRNISISLIGSNLTLPPPLSLFIPLRKKFRIEFLHNRRNKCHNIWRDQCMLKRASKREGGRWKFSENKVSTKLGRYHVIPYLSYFIHGWKPGTPREFLESASTSHMNRPTERNNKRDHLEEKW